MRVEVFMGVAAEPSGDEIAAVMDEVRTYAIEYCGALRLSEVRFDLHHGSKGRDIVAQAGAGLSDAEGGDLARAIAAIYTEFPEACLVVASCDVAESPRSRGPSKQPVWGRP